MAERLQAFRGRALSSQDLVRADGRLLSLAAFDDRALPDLVDLDEPAILVGLGVRPSQVATMDRSVTQRLALDLFTSGAIGLSWWSTLEASWGNVTLFDVRLREEMLVLTDVIPLTLGDRSVEAALDRLGIRHS